MKNDNNEEIKVPMHMQLFNSQEEIEEYKEQIKEDREERLKIDGIMKTYDTRIKNKKIQLIMLVSLSTLIITFMDLLSITSIHEYLTKSTDIGNGTIIFQLICTLLKLGVIGENISVWYSREKLKDEKKATYDKLWKEYKESKLKKEEEKLNSK